MRHALWGTAPLALIAATPASALVLVTDTGWVGDTIQFAGGPTTGSPITFTITRPSIFRITDCCIAGDTYRLFQAGSLVATSTLFAGAPLPQYGGDTFYEPFWESASYSKIAYSIGPGTYAFIITGDGAGGVPAALGLRLDSVTPVPETATWALMVAGFASFGAAMRRRRHDVTVRYA